MKNKDRITVYLGVGDERDMLRGQMDFQATHDVRFRGSPQNFARYAIRYTLENDPSLKRFKMPKAGA